MIWLQIQIFVIVVLMILIRIAWCTRLRGCIHVAKWKPQSCQSSPGVRMIRVHDWTLGRHWRREVFPDEFRVTLLKHDGQTVVWRQENEWNWDKQNWNEITPQHLQCLYNSILRDVATFRRSPRGGGGGIIPSNINYILANLFNYHYN